MNEISILVNICSLKSVRARREARECSPVSSFCASLGSSSSLKPHLHFDRRSWIAIGFDFSFRSPELFAEELFAKESDESAPL